MWSPSPLSKKSTAAAANIAATSAPAGIDTRPNLTSDAAIGGDTPIEVVGEMGAPFEREALFQDEATRMSSFDWDFTTWTGEATTCSFQDMAAMMPSFEDVSAMTPLFNHDASIMKMSNIKGYK